MNASFDLDAPDHFTTGAVGAPGQRVFYLQGREAGTLVTLKTEKEQVAALAEYLGALLARLPERAAEPAGDLALLEPLSAAWNVGSIGVGYDQDVDRIVIVASERVEGDEDGDDEDEAEEDDGEQVETATAVELEPEPAVEPDVARAGDETTEPEPEAATARFRITRGQAAAFVDRARAVVRAGRPVCPLCSGPIDPGGHVCPRSNGHIVKS